MRVLVTRAADDYKTTAAALAALGHAAVPAPVVEIVRQAIRWPAGRPKALLATSHHAFTADIPADWLAALPVFAVGARTGEAARQAGFKDVRVGAGDGEALAPLVVLTLPRPGPLLYLAGRDRKAGLEAALEAAGYRILAVETYAAVPVERWPMAACEALRAGRVEAALHYSRRSADLAVALARRHDVSDPFVALHHLCLSADAAEPLRIAKARSVAVAERPDQNRLLALLQTLRTE